MSISSTVVDRAEIRFHEAPEAIRHLVGCFWITTLESGATIRLVPDGSTTIAVQLEHGRAPDWYLRGPVVQPDVLHFASPSQLIGVRLRPGVGFLLCGVPAHTTVGRRIALPSLATFQHLVARGVRAAAATECLEILREFVVARLHGARLHPVVVDVLGEIESSSGCLSVSRLSSNRQVSPRHLNRLMREWVGFGPKRYSQVVRLQTALAGVDRAAVRSTAALATATGYFDQAHLTRDLTRFTGATPRELATRYVADFSKTRCS